MGANENRSGRTDSVGHATRVDRLNLQVFGRIRVDGAHTGVDVVDSEAVLFEWLGRSGTPEFKELQALVK